jgi:hypothetical protein
MVAMGQKSCGNSSSSEEKTRVVRGAATLPHICNVLITRARGELRVPTLKRVYRVGGVERFSNRGVTNMGAYQYTIWQHIVDHEKVYYPACFLLAGYLYTRRRLG